MNRFVQLFTWALLLIVIQSCDLGTGSKDNISNSGTIDIIEKGWQHRDSVLAEIKAPSFGDMTFNIVDFGAVADSITDCSGAIHAAIDSCNASGGGSVVVPAGVFYTGPIHLKSNVNLFVSEGARLLFSNKPVDYTPNVLTRFEGMECYNYSPLIYAYEQENVAVTGKGVLDGNGVAWWLWKGKWDGSIDHGWREGMVSQKEDVALLTQMVADNVPVEERIFGEGHYLRSSFVQPYKCKNVLLADFKIVGAPMWILHPVLCENVTVKNVHIESLGPNNDGCDPECCKNVLITDCFFNTGDDCIAIKSGRNNDGRRLGIPAENTIVQNCTMVEGHGGVVIGSEISGNVKYVFAENCVMDSPHLDRAIRIKSNSERGGHVEHVYARNIEVKQVREAVLKINLFYSNGIGENIPTVSDVYLEGFVSHSSKYAMWIKAYKEHPVKNVYFIDSELQHVANGSIIENAENIRLDGTTINGKAAEL